MTSFDYTEEFAKYKLQKKTSGTLFSTRGNAGIFLALSIDKSTDKEYKYYEESEHSSPYIGIHTNDAPVEHLIDSVVEDGYNLTRIVCIATPEVTDSPDGKPSTYLRFCEFVKYYTKQVWGIDSCTVTPINYNNSASSENAYATFYKELQNQTNDLSVFYVDYTGGFRDTSLLMVIAMRFLEFKGISCKKIIYSDFHANPKRLKNLTSLYSLFQMINGMSEFVSSGTTRTLSDAFKNTEKPNELLLAIQRFAHSTNVGDMQHLDERISDLNFELGKDYTVSSDLKNVMVGSMADVIRTKLYGTDKKDSLTDSRGNTDYLRLIDWCIDNKMYQQAATLYIEKIPFYYYHSGITKNLIDFIHPNETVDSTAAFYTDLRDWLDDNEREINFKQKLQEISNLVSGYSNNDWDYSDFLKKAKNILSAEFKDSYQRLEEIVKNKYKGYKKIQAETKPEPTGLHDYFENTYQWPNNIQKFINDLNSKAPLRDYLLNNNPQSYKERSGRDDKNRTFYICKQLFNSNRRPKTNDDKGIAILLAFYLAIKLLRNEMSHAAETSATEELKRNLERLLQNFLDMNNTYDAKIHITLEERHINGLLITAMAYAKNATSFFRAKI